MPGNLIVDAVKRGDGITFSGRQWFDEELQSGRLIGALPELEPCVFYIEASAGEYRSHVLQLIEWLKRHVKMKHGF